MRKKKRVLYGINGTGQGHLSRAKSLIPYLKQHVELDFLLSGKMQHINFEYPITYEYRGFTFVYEHGGVNWFKTLKNIIAVATKDAVLCVDQNKSESVRIVVEKLIENKIEQAEKSLTDFRP